jgi:hypothetical protein
MATSPLFGWEEPDDVDLVKDGAAAIRTLGNAIDTSMGDLLGGTTGQVLSKNSNTNMDFTWVTSDDANAIQNTIVDAKGDLISATGSDVPARLAVGANGETLVADSSTSTGLRYTAGNPISNPVINSAFQIAQRGTSFSTASAAYTLDRWYALAASAGTVSRQVTGDTTNLPNIQYCARFQRTAGSTSTTGFSLSNSFETLNSIPYAGKTVTLSFYARAGANYSPTSSAFGSRVWTGTGTDQAIQGTYTGASFTINNTATLTTTWQRFSYSGALPAATTEMAIQFFCDPTGTAGANDYFEVTGVQIDIGSVALPFRTNGATIQAELEACERYFQLLTPTDAFQDILTGASCDQTAFCRYPFVFPTIMRRTPTCSNTGTAGDYGNLVAAGYAGASAAPSFANIRNTGVTIYVYSSSITTGQGTCLRNSTSFPSQWLTFSAEL